MTRIPCLHLGYHKCASTTLQEQLFDRHPDLVNLGKPYRDEQLARLVGAVSGQDSLAYRHEDWSDIVRAALDRAPPGKTAILSDEIFASNRGADRALMAERLSTLFGPSRVVMVVRSQPDLVLSYYFHLQRGHRSETFARWLDRQWRYFNLEALPALDYFAFAETYAAQFGRENVGVFAVEELSADPTAFLDRLCEFIGIEVGSARDLMAGPASNVRASARMTAYTRWRAHFFPGVAFSRYYPKFLRCAFHGLLNGGRRAQVAYPAGERERLVELYRESNRKLAETYRLPLAEYGYPL
jgi:hypothetical protein